MLKVIQFLVGIYVYIVAGTEEEFCISEIFQPRCSGPDEVIVILEAHFGRKRIGRCLKDEQAMEAINEDKRFLGCYSDVKHLVSPKCSGKTSCEVRVAEFPPPTTCFNFLRFYLGVSFRCLRMIQNNRQCLINLVDSEAQYLLIKEGANNCGSTGHPWTVEALTGQTIQGTLMDFSKSTESDQEQHLNQRQCFNKIGHIHDRISNSNLTLCSPRGHNSSLLFSYQSKSNALEIGFESSLKRDSFGFYVIKLQATGCSDLMPPADAWLKRTENEATIGCYSTRLRWQLKCLGQRWVGVIGNCSHGNQISVSDSSPSSMEKTNENSVVTIVAIAMVGFVICFLIICSGVVFLNRYYALSKSKSIKQMALYNGDLNQTLKNTNGQLMNFESNFDGLEKLTKIDTRTTVRDDEQQNQQYFELDRSLVTNEVVMKMMKM